MAAKRSVNSSDIEALRQLLANTAAQVFAPADDGYAQTVQRWSRAAEKPAGVSVVPSSSEEAAVAVRYAREHGLDLAVMGGGHSTSGASSTHGGVLLNLRGMRGVRVDVAAQRLHVQGGATWADVDAAAWAHGLATVGGTVADTGVGGLTLGGGYGTLSGQRGLVIDNMVAATVVLASGEVVHASESEHADLFWALRGAGQNFGVTTEFVLQAYPQGEIFTGLLLFPPTPENVERLVANVNELYETKQTPDGPKCKSDGRTMTLLAMAKPPPAGGATMLLTICSYLGSEKEGREVFKPFFDLGPVVDTMQMQPWPVVNNLVPASIGKRSSMKGAAFIMPLRKEFVASVLQSYDDFTSACPDASDSLVAFELYDANVVATKDAGCFANRGYHLNGLVMPSWEKAENDQFCRQWAREASNLFKTELEAHGVETAPGIEGGASVRGHKGAVLLYGNYDQYDEISKDIFGSNYPRLQQIKGKYDPSNMFNKLFPIQPELTVNGNGHV